MILDGVFLRKLERLSFHVRHVRAGQVAGERRSTKRGTSVEFADYRDYAQGDDLRWVDWNVYARLERPFVKLFEEEEDLAVHLLLDGSGSMDWGGGRGDKGTRRQGDKETGRRGDKGTGGQGDKETGRQGDKGTRRQGDQGTRGQGDGETRGQGDKGTRRPGEQVGVRAAGGGGAGVCCVDLRRPAHRGKSSFSILHSPFSIRPGARARTCGAVVRVAGGGGGRGGD
jgi:hypothetical protein